MSLASASPFLPYRASAALQVHLLGVVDFDAALLLQKSLVREIAGRNDRFGALLLCEHPPLITIGREGSRLHVRADERELTARGLCVRWVNRGGGAIVHAPGQLAVYPVLPLDRLDVGPAEFRNRLEDAVIAACRELRVPAERIRPGSGVECRCGRFAFVGAAVKSWVGYFGMNVNVAPSMDLQRLVQTPAGPPVTSLAAQRQRPVSMHAVREAIVRHLAAGFDYETVHVQTGHPFLRRTRRKVPLPAADPVALTVSGKPFDETP